MDKSKERRRRAAKKRVYLSLLKRANKIKTKGKTPIYPQDSTKLIFPQKLSETGLPKKSGKKKVIRFCGGSPPKLFQDSATLTVREVISKLGRSWTAAKERLTRRVASKR